MKSYKYRKGDLIFKAVYFSINFFIEIGENTQKTIKALFFLPWIIARFFLSSVKEFLKSAYLLLRKKKPAGRHYTTIPFIWPSIPALGLPFFKIKVKTPNFKIIGMKIRYFIIGSLITFLVLFSYQSYLFVKSLPAPSNIGKINYPLSSHIYDRNGKLLYEIYREQNRTPVSLKNLPAHVYQATIAIEDKDFYNHNGVSLYSGILRALKETLTKKKLQGGSTITQQLVKSALLTPERTIERKIKEIILALWTEQLFSKDRILEMYLNQVPYGGSSYGIEEASKVYFGKLAKELTLSEAAMLAGLPQAPSIYSPHINPDLAVYRRNEVLKAMKEQGLIDNEVYSQSLDTVDDIKPPKTAIRAPHFVFYAKSQLESLYGIKSVEESGLKVTTTLDLDIQEQAQKILEEELAKIQNLNVTNGAILITKPDTGEIIAMVGSVDYFSSTGAFNVTTGLRQPGSSIKPILYSLALQKNYTASTMLDDTPVVYNFGSESYKPINYDGKYHGKVPLRYALANSYNVPAVRVLNTLGVRDFLNYAAKMGISTWTRSNQYGLSLALGGGEVTMVDMAEAFGVLANTGYKIDPATYLKIQDVSGEVIRELNPYKIKVLDEGISYIVSDILSDNFARQLAFGPKSSLEIPGYQVAVKTGTTNDKKDNWTIGYTPDFLVVVWVGNNNNQPMHPYLTSGITGAAPVWNRVMNYLLKNYTSGNKWYPKPENVTEKNCYFGRKEYFIKGTEKNSICSGSVYGATPTPTKSP